MIAGTIFGVCVGYLVAYFREKKHVDELLDCCEKTSEKLAKLSTEYEDFMKAAHDLDRWPKHSAHIPLKDNLADYLKNKYFGDGPEDTDWSDCEDEVDNLYI